MFNNHLKLYCDCCGQPRKRHPLKTGGTASETYYTAPDGRHVCATCLAELTGHRPRTLKQINDARRKLAREKAK